MVIKLKFLVKYYEAQVDQKKFTCLLHIFLRQNLHRFTFLLAAVKGSFYDYILIFHF